MGLTSLASKAKFVRTKLKITQEEFSLKTDISVVTISRWENGNALSLNLNYVVTFWIIVILHLMSKEGIKQWQRC